MATVKQIKSFATSHLTISLHCAFHQSIEKLINEATPAALHIETHAAQYAIYVSDEQIISNRQTTYISTKELEKEGGLRNNIVGVILNVVKAHRTSTIAAKAEAASRLSAVLAPYYGVGKRQYAEATLDVKQMIAVLNSEECTAWVETLNLAAEVDEAETRNATMEALIEQKSRENVARTTQTDVDTLELRRLTDNVYNQIITIVNAYAIVSTSDTINQFIANVNGTIDTYKSFIDGNSSDTPTTDTGDETTPDEGGDEGGEEDLPVIE